MPGEFIKPIVIVLIFAIAGWLVFWQIFILIKKKRGLKINKVAQLTILLFYAYIIGVLSLTIFPLPFARFKKPNHGINIIPVLYTVKGLLEMPRSVNKTLAEEHNFENLAGNIILFMPLGIFVPLLFPAYRTINRVLVIAALCSVSIELTQLIERQFEIYRIVDIDDVILNTSGAVIGFMLLKKFYFNKGIIQ